MHLHGLVYYRSKSDEWTEKWSSSDYAARNLVAALKRREFNGYSNIKVGQTNYHIDNTVEGQANALVVASRVIAQKIQDAGYEAARVVPIPASDHIDPCGEFTGRRLAEAIQGINANFRAAPVLYFNEVQLKSADGGTRDPHEIKQHLRIAGDLDGPVVLLDDVCTTGGHLKAAARFLADLDHEVEDAFVVGRTAWEKPEKMFAVERETIHTKPFGGIFG